MSGGEGSGVPERWFVTGASGQLGQSLCAVGRQEGLELVGLGHRELDVGDRRAVDELFSRVHPDVVVNCAAFTHVDRCESEEAAARRTNAEGPANLAEASRKAGCLLVHVSTDYVFSGEDSATPIPEDAPARPRSAYGRTKCEGEEAVRAAGGESLIVRSQWIFGPGPNFVRTIYGAIREGRALRVAEDQIGRPTWTRPLAEAIVQAVRSRTRGCLHLACEGVASWFDLAVAIVEEGAGRGWIERVPVEPVSTEAVPRPAPRPPYSVLGLGRARGLGITLPHWRAALSAYMDSEEWQRA